MTHENVLVSGEATPFGNIVRPGDVAVIDQMLAPDKPVPTVEQVKQEEQKVEDQQAPWFYVFHDKPSIHARLTENGWEVTVIDGDRLGHVTSRERNLFFRAVRVALRRHERRRTFQNLVAHRKSEAEKRKEVEAAMEKSAAEGNLSLTPATRI